MYQNYVLVLYGVLDAFRLNPSIETNRYMFIEVRFIRFKDKLLIWISYQYNLLIWISYQYKLLFWISYQYVNND